MRAITDREGVVWAAELVSHGRTSAYLNPKVHRPVVQFTCRTAKRARKYASLPLGRDAIDDLSDGELGKLLERAESH